MLLKSLVESLQVDEPMSLVTTSSVIKNAIFRTARERGLSVARDPKGKLVIEKRPQPTA